MLCISICLTNLQFVMAAPVSVDSSWPQLVAYNWSVRLQAGPAKSAANGADFALAVFEHILHWCMQHVECDVDIVHRCCCRSTPNVCQVFVQGTLSTSLGALVYDILAACSFWCQDKARGGQLEGILNLLW